MKNLVLLILFFGAASAKLYTPEQQAKFKMYLRDCQEITKIERRMIEDLLINGQVADDTSFKNFLFCFYKKINVIDEHGIVDETALKNLADSLQNPGNIALNGCIDKRGPNGPETSFLIEKCYMQNLPKDVDASIDF